jgi:hypothetical protein
MARNDTTATVYGVELGNFGREMRKAKVTIGSLMTSAILLLVTGALRGHLRPTKW